MTAPTPESRAAAAADLAGRIADEVFREDQKTRTGAHWYLNLLDIRDTLADTDCPAEERLRDGALMLSTMYSTARNFGDFYIDRDDPELRVAENRRFSAMVDELFAVLFPRE